MVGGAVVAGLTDLTFSGPGYAWVSLCVVSTAVYLLLIKKLKDSTGEALVDPPLRAPGGSARELWW